ncbi:MAG: mercury methylation corrinoid protein HgcA [Syntrophaceae bacterium]|nr:mercury methylation corrinoid protein HgcA [Syntrophaceae bacterium]
MRHPSLKQPFVISSIQSVLGPVPVVNNFMTFADWLGTARVRCGIKRENYMVDPGLYAFGSPDSESEILVTSNYKLSFDSLRACLKEKSFWILVLDTQGINVWCAAGKGTFGTAELVSKIMSCSLHRLVKHRCLIVPQLGASGISAYETREKTDFKVIFGPVDCRNLLEFINNGKKSNEAMRTKTFTIADRLTLIPIELLHYIKIGCFLCLLVLIISGLIGSGTDLENVKGEGLFIVFGIFSGILTGAFWGPMLLPWLPGGAFSVKGLFIGLICALLLLLSRHVFYGNPWSWNEALVWIFTISSVSSYITLNFTGSSTYTSLSGVKKEMRWAIPLQIIGFSCGMVLALVTIFDK